MTDTTFKKPEGAHAPVSLQSAGSNAKAHTSQAKAAKKPAIPARKERRQTKASKVEALLARKAGATLDQMCDATGWQAHTCRAFMSGQRKKGREIVRDTGETGKSFYRLAAANAATKAS